MNTLLIYLFVAYELARLSEKLVPLLGCASLFVALLVILIQSLRGKKS